MNIKPLILAGIIAGLTACTTASKVGEQEVVTASLTETYWKLTILDGQPVTMSTGQDKEAYLMFKVEDNRLVGYSGCNSFAGSYLLEEGNRIRIGKLATTMRACIDNGIDEREFYQSLEMADNYNLQGNLLHLNIGRRAALMSFEAVYF